MTSIRLSANQADLKASCVRTAVPADLLQKYLHDAYPTPCRLPRLGQSPRHRWDSARESRLSSHHRTSSVAVHSLLPIIRAL